MRKIFIISAILLVFFIIFIAYEFFMYREFAIPGFSYYTRCASVSCNVRKQPTNLRTLYPTYCCGKEMAVGCDKTGEGVSHNNYCHFICFGDYYKKGGVVMPPEDYCD